MNEVNSNGKIMDDTRVRKQSYGNAGIQCLEWMAGHWVTEAFGGVAEETWLPPRAGTMLGMYRLIKENKVVFYELMSIEELDPEGLTLSVKHFYPGLIGWEEKAKALRFKGQVCSSDVADFDGLKYQKLNDQQVKVFLDMRQEDGKVRVKEFTYQRV